MTQKIICKNEDCKHNRISHSNFQIAFSYPSGGLITDIFHRSVVEMTLYELTKSRAGDKLQDHQHLGSFLWTDPSCYVGINRSKITTSLAHSKNDTHILMIDTDVSFKPNIIDLIVAHLVEFPQVEILAGRVNLGNGYPVFYKEEYGAIVHQIQPFYGVKEFDYVGTGIICISKLCIETLIKKEGHPSLFMHQLGPDKREFGDDLSFCKVARRNGFKLFGAWRVYGQHWKEQPVKQSYPEDIIELAPSFKAVGK